MSRTESSSALRGLPSVDALLQTESARALLSAHSHPLVVEALRSALAGARERVLNGDGPVDAGALLGEAEAALAATFASSLRPVINGTGIIVHTNLGRAPLSRAALAAMT